MSSQQDSFSERIYPSVGVSLALLALDFSIVFAVWAALDLFFAIVIALVVLSLSLLWWFKAIARIEVRAGTLQVNQARIEIRLLKGVQALTGEPWRRRRGADFDPRLFHAHRFWMKSGVEFTLDDPRDPHPAWLVGSKRNQELSALVSELIARN